MKNQLLIIDGSSYIFRAFYGVRADLKNQHGLPTNAVFGFKNMMSQLLQEEDPSHCIMVFDKPGPTFRHEIFKEYKANRDAAPDDLKAQFEPIYQFSNILNIPIVWIDGFEADDVIGSLVRTFSSQIKVTIISGDKDLTQLVTADVKMHDTMKNEIYTPERVKEKFGVLPALIPEYLAIVGDASDNIPGAAGIGPKTAVKLISQFGSLEGIYNNLDKLKGKQKENLESFKKNMELSLQLTKIRCDLEFESTLDDYARKDPDLEQLISFYTEMNFREDSFIKLHPDFKEKKVAYNDTQARKLDYDKYELILNLENLKELQQTLMLQAEIVIDLETTSLRPVEAEIVGISFAWKGGNPVYIPVAHTEATPQIPLEIVLDILKPVFQKKDLAIIGQNIKYEIMVLAKYGIELEGDIHDTMLQSYLLDANLQRHNLNDLAERHLQHRMIKYEEVVGKGKNQISFADVPLQKALHYAAEDSEATLKIHEKLFPRLAEINLGSMYHEIELPLSRTLAKMETHGVKIEVDYLRLLCDRLRDDLELLKQKIYLQAGEEFNINSTQQLATILFEKMGITAGKKKTKTGYSTNAAVLEQIAQFEPIASDLLTYRTKNKLVNTYLEVFPTLISPQTGRIHTSYSQAVTTTGRLSSSRPNLQNIPIKGEDGAKIRKAFIPEPGHLIISADYSQIELRFLAHLSGDESLIEVYKQNGDIHTETAAAIYQTPKENITNNQRQAAKSINFGIIYGMGAFRLAREINVTNQQARMFIEAYFKKYPKIKTYMDETIAFCRENLFVETIFHRKRTLPDINAKNHMIRSAAERMAINSRIQGSSADLIKIAMIEIQRKLEQTFPQTRMIMQIHDELVFEASEEEVDKVIPIIKKIMEQSATLRVPLVVEISYGNNWQEAH